MIWYNKSWFQIMRSWFVIINPDFKSCVHDLTYKLWFNLIHDSCQFMWHMTISVSDMGNSQTCRMIYQGQSLLLCLRRFKGLSTRLHRVSQSHQLARPLPQVQPPSPQQAPLQAPLHEYMIWHQDLLYQIINLWFEISINHIKS